MSDTAEALKALLGDVITFYLMAHGCHWNVEGPDFAQYHSLFEKIYDDVYSSVDPIAENIRKLDEYVPFDLKELVSTRSIDFKPVKPDPKSMAKMLLENNDKVIKAIDKAFKAATKENEQGICNFLADRDDKHKFWRWWLRASLK
jgi:starvation-inducible DNA-binding protein